MKDSGIEWIGEIPKEWKICRIKELFHEVNERCDDGSDYTLLSVSEYYGVAPRASKINDDDLLTHSETLDGYKVCHKHDIVMNIMLAWKGSLGLSEYVGIVSPAYCVYRANMEIDEKYFHYLFRTDLYTSLFKQFSTGIIDSRLRLYPDKFLSLKCQVAPLPTQHRIADYLDDKCGKIDRYIEQQKQVIEKLKAYKQSVITEAVTKGLDPTVPMKDSGVEWIGEIPEGWEVRKLKSLTTIISKGTTPTTVGKDLVDFGNIRFIKCENIIGGEIENEPEFFIDEETNEKLKRSKLEINDILFVIAGATIGKTAIVKESNLPANTNQAVSFVRLKNKSDARFVWYYLQSNMVKAVLKLLSVQSAQPNLSMTDLGNFYLPYTEYKTQNEIDNYLDKKCSAIDSAIEKKQTLIDKLTEYKKSLIYEVVTGKREVQKYGKKQL